MITSKQYNEYKWQVKCFTCSLLYSLVFAWNLASTRQGGTIWIEVKRMILLDSLADKLIMFHLMLVLLVVVVVVVSNWSKFDLNDKMDASTW